MISRYGLNVTWMGLVNHRIKRLQLLGHQPLIHQNGAKKTLTGHWNRKSKPHSVNDLR